MHFSPFGNVTEGNFSEHVLHKTVNSKICKHDFQRKKYEAKNVCRSVNYEISDTLA